MMYVCPLRRPLLIDVIISSFNPFEASLNPFKTASCMDAIIMCYQS